MGYNSSDFLYIILDGQKIAKKLEGQIQCETLKIKSVLPKYNSCQLVLQQQGKMEICFKEALDPQFLARELQYNMFCSKEKQALINAHLRIIRSAEEITLIQQEMQSTLNYYSNTLDVVSGCITTHSIMQSPFERGAVSLLVKLQQSIQMRKKECQEKFGPILHPTDCNDVIDNDYDDYDDDDDVGDVDEEDVDSHF